MLLLYKIQPRVQHHHGMMLTCMGHNSCVSPQNRLPTHVEICLRVCNVMEGSAYFHMAQTQQFGLTWQGAIPRVSTNMPHASMKVKNSE